MIGGIKFFPADTAEECPYSEEHFNEVAKLLSKHFKKTTPLVFIPTSEATLYFATHQWAKGYSHAKWDTPNRELHNLPNNKKEFENTYERLIRNATKNQTPVVLFSHYGPKGVKRILKLLGSRKKFNSKEYKTIFQTNIKLKTP